MPPLISYVVPSGSAVGTPVDMRQYPGGLRLIGYAIPSGDLFLQGALPSSGGGFPNSGDFSRIIDTWTSNSGNSGQSPVRFIVGATSGWISIPNDRIAMPPFIRPELSAAVIAPNTLTLSVFPIKQ